MGLSEVTLTLVDPELVEAAKFVLEGGAAESPAVGPVAVPDSAYGAPEKAFNTEGTEGAEKNLGREFDSGHRG